MKRFWPIGLALFCWLLVLLVPATRRGLVESWKYPNVYARDDTNHREVPPFVGLSNSAANILKQYPDDKDVKVYLARFFQRSDNLKAVAAMYPDDAFIVAMQLNDDLQGLPSERVAGSMSNPNYPAAPPKVTPLTAKQKQG
ncbi:hypothetical protein EON80_23195, partial [bacterium]